VLIRSAGHPIIGSTKAPGKQAQLYRFVQWVRLLAWALWQFVDGALRGVVLRRAA
jgi:hypothetical protein